MRGEVRDDEARKGMRVPFAHSIKSQTQRTNFHMLSMQSVRYIPVPLTAGSIIADFSIFTAFSTFDDLTVGFSALSLVLLATAVTSDCFVFTCLVSSPEGWTFVSASSFDAPQPMLNTISLVINLKIDNKLLGTLNLMFIRFYSVCVVLSRWIQTTFAHRILDLRCKNLNKYQSYDGSWFRFHCRSFKNLSDKCDEFVNEST